jgi:hypothetical protein
MADLERFFEKNTLGPLGVKKPQNLRFWFYIKVPQANYFWVEFGYFGQYWVECAAFAVVESLPKLWEKS